MRNTLFVALMCVTALCGCKHNKSVEIKNEVTQLSPKDSLKYKAEKAFMPLIDKKYPHGYNEKPEITDYEIVMNDDSLYWAEFKMKYQNEFGGWSNGEFNYIYVLEYDGTPKSGIRDYSKDFNSKFSMTLAHFQSVATEKRGLPDSLVYGNNQFLYQSARVFCLAINLLNE